MISGEQLRDLLRFLPRPTSGPVQSSAKEGSDLHGQAAVRLSLASCVARVDHKDLHASCLCLDLHGETAICLDVVSFEAMWAMICRSTWAS